LVQVVGRIAAASVDAFGVVVERPARVHEHKHRRVAAMRGREGVDGVQGVSGAPPVGGCVDHGRRQYGRPTLHAGDSGLRDHDVKPAELRNPVLQGRAQLRGIAHVCLGDHRALAGLLDVLGCRHGVTDGVDVTAQVDGDDVGAFLGQPHRAAGTLPARRGGDEGDLSLYAPLCTVSHRSSSYFVAMHRGLPPVLRCCYVFLPPLTPSI
jgi:hypothetical protein